jgi:hypothetical protein
MQWRPSGVSSFLLHHRVLVTEQVDNFVHLVERPNAAFINGTIEGHRLLLANGHKTGVSLRAHLATFETCAREVAMVLLAVPETCPVPTENFIRSALRPRMG